MHLAGTLIAVSLAAQPIQNGVSGPITSGDLLKQGFEDIASGELMSVREFRFRAPDRDGFFKPGCHAWLGYISEPLVARMRIQDVPSCGRVVRDEVQYEGFVRMKRAEQEFVCVLGTQESCYRVSGGGI